MNKLVSVVAGLGMIGSLAIGAPSQAADTGGPPECVKKLNNHYNCTQFYNSSDSDDPIWAYSDAECKGWVVRLDPGENTNQFYTPRRDWTSVRINEGGTVYRFVISNWDTGAKYSYKGTTSGSRCFAKFPNNDGENKIWFKLYDPGEH